MKGRRSFKYSLSNISHLPRNPFNMYKVLAVLLVVAVVAQAGFVAPFIGGVSHTQRVQSHIPLGVYGYGVPFLGKGIGLGYGGLYGGYGLGHGLGYGLGYGGIIG